VTDSTSIGWTAKIEAAKKAVVGFIKREADEERY